MSENTDEQPTDETTSDEKSTDEGNLHVTDHGADDGGGGGHTVVLIHGWPLSEDSWQPQVEALKKDGHRVVTYDRRGFGQSGPGDGYDYDKLAGDLDNVIKDLDLDDVVLVGFSMGGGEVARYVSNYGEDRLSGVVFAAAIPPALLKSDDNPDGPLDEESANGLRKGLEDDREGFLKEFMRGFYSAGDELKVSEDQLEASYQIALKSDEQAALEAMDAWGTDFRDDIAKVTVPALIIHGDSDGTVPVEGSGQRTHDAIDGSTLVVVEGGPHGVNASHPDEFNKALLEFLDGLD